MSGISEEELPNLITPESTTLITDEVVQTVAKAVDEFYTTMAKWIDGIAMILYSEDPAGDFLHFIINFTGKPALS